jgi:hypothetical protein
VTLTGGRTGRHCRPVAKSRRQVIEVHLSWDMSSVPPGRDPRTLQAIRYEVRAKGGGNVQRAFGRLAC